MSSFRSAVTVSLVPEAKGGPFVYWDGLQAACEKAARLGFDAVEIFPSSASDIDPSVVNPLFLKHGLKVSSVGTGGGWVKHKLTLTSTDASVRARAKEFIASIIGAAGAVGAPAIIGSMQGRWGEGLSRQDAVAYLTDALEELAARAERLKVPLFYEPLNRYETNIVNTLADGVALLRQLATKNVKLLADLYHMNIEEVSVAGALREAGDAVGHVHLADSNRRPAGNGHTDFAAVAKALRDIKFGGYLSAECFAWPDPDAAAAATIKAFKTYFG